MNAIALYDRKPGSVFATVQGDIDLSSADGRTMARVMIAFANKSSMDTSRRVARKHLEVAQKGVVTGGKRPFGYEDDKITINEREAAALRQAVTDVMAGYPMHGIVRQWNAAGITTPFGNNWVQSTLRNLLTSPHIGGYRVHRGVIARDDLGNPVMANRPPLIEPATSDALRTFLADPSRKIANAHRGPRKRLLSGLLRCGICGKGMSADFHAREKVHTYICKAPSSRGGCGRIAVSGPRVDELITKVVLERYARIQLPVEAEPWGREAELQEAQRRIQELMTSYTSGQLSSDLVFPAISKLEKRINELKAERATFTVQQAVAANRPENVADVWDDYDVLQRRMAIEMLIQAVVVNPATKKGGRFDSNRISVVWRADEQSLPSAPH